METCRLCFNQHNNCPKDEYPNLTLSRATEVNSRLGCSNAIEKIRKHLEDKLQPKTNYDTTPIVPPAFAPTGKKT